MLIKRSLHQSPDHSVPSAKAICKQGEIYTHRKKSHRRCGDGSILLGAAQTLRQGLAVVLVLSLFEGPPLSVTLVVSCVAVFCISLGPSVGIRVCLGGCIETSLCNCITIAVLRRCTY